MLKIPIVVEPVVARPGTFAANWDGVELSISSEPLLAAARVLIRRGVSPDTILVMRHRGADHDALRGQLGALAKFTVEDAPNGRPRLRRYRPPPLWGVSPPDDKMAIHPWLIGSREKKLSGGGHGFEQGGAIGEGPTNPPKRNGRFRPRMGGVAS